MAQKYQAYSDALFESDDETELDDARVEEKSGQEGVDLFKNGSAMVNKEDTVLITQTNETNLGYKDSTCPTGTLEGWIEKEEGELRETCHICGKEVGLLDKHILANHQEEVKCQMCSKRFPVDKLRLHILLDHCHNKYNKCSLCKQIFVSNNSLQNHIKKIHLSQQECRGISQHDNFATRIKEVEYGNEYTNGAECGKAITNSNLQMPIQSEHKKIKQVREVGKKAFCIDAIDAHKRTVHNTDKPLFNVTPKEPTLYINHQRVGEF